MFQPNPPTPKAMSDAELNAKIAELQLQPDGLVAAMAFIEEQSKLRQQDALEYSKWELASQMHAATPRQVDASELQDPAFPAPEFSSQPEPVVPEVYEPIPEPAPAVVAEQVLEEPAIDIFANLPVEPAPPVVEVPTPPVIDPPFIEQPVVPVEAAAAPPVENLDDIVAALNASYAVAATEPETTEPSDPETTEPKANAHEESRAPEVSEQMPQPIDSPVTVLSPEVEPAEQSWLEETEKEKKASETTGTAVAFSFSWLAVAGTPLALVLAALLKEAGASLAQSFILLAGTLFLTSVLASVGSMSSARASSSLTVVSRAAFGVWGNSLPASLMLVVKLFWSAALIYFATRIISPLIFNQPWFANVSGSLVFPEEFTAAVFVIGPIIIVSAIAAGIGGAVMLRLQQLTAIVSVVAIGVFVYFVASTYSLEDLERGQSIAQTSLLDLSLLLVAIFGFALISSSGDFARKLPQTTPGAKVFFLTFVSTFFLPLIAGVLGLMWLFMAGDTLGSSFLNEVLATVAGSAPIWVFVVFVVAIGISIVQLISASLYSLSGSMIGLIKLPGWISQLVIVVAVLMAVLIPSYLVGVSVLQESITEVFVLAGVIAAAWIGILVSDALARTRGYHEVSLTREYGFYGRVNAANTIGFVLAVALGFGYLNGGPQLSSWSGYLGNLTPEIFELAGSNIGIAMAFGLAVLFPVVFGIPRIKKQEQNLSELDQRREELKEFLDSAS
jgi:nucleobase:cation symporter-1, NCS1 family